VISTIVPRRERVSLKTAASPGSGGEKRKRRRKKERRKGEEKKGKALRLTLTPLR
jgi:hypothetical protein